MVRDFVRRALSLAGPVAIAATAGGLGLLPAIAAQEQVNAQDYSFSRPSITVQVGDTIKFKNVGQSPHTASANSSSFNGCNRNLNSGQECVAGPFNSPGTINYRCEYHYTAPWFMTGTITVQGGGSSPSPSPSPQTQSPSPSPASGTSPKPSPKASPTAGASPKASPGATASPATALAGSPTGEASPTESPTSTPVAAPPKKAGEGGGISTPAKVGIGALVVAGAAGTGLWWLRKTPG